MKQQVLTFYTKLLAHIRQPLLPHINVHRPVQVSRRDFYFRVPQNVEIYFIFVSP